MPSIGNSFKTWIKNKKTDLAQPGAKKKMFINGAKSFGKQMVIMYAINQTFSMLGIG
jgi:hypothetical protein